MYFLRGGLPWQGLKAATNKQKVSESHSTQSSLSLYVGDIVREDRREEVCTGSPLHGIPTDKTPLTSRQTTPIKELCEGFPGSLCYPNVVPLHAHRLFTEEFGIYLNYVRKLGFEETPDYDFLRELFTKVLKNLGEVEDGIYDWHLLAQNGKSWEVSRRSTPVR